MGVLVGDVHVTVNGSNAVDGHHHVHRQASQHEFKATVLALRGMTMVLLIIGFALMVTNKQTQSIPVKLPGMSSTIYLQRSASFSQIRGVQFYVGAIAIVLLYQFFQIMGSVFSIFVSGSMVGSKVTAWMTFILDQLMAYLLVSAASAVTEIGFIATKGESKVGWNQVCSDFSHFCTMFGLSVVNSYVALVVFLPVVVASFFHLFALYADRIPK